jgi:hypothetical protein
MTTLQLTFIIFVALITQLAMFATMAFYQHWQTLAELGSDAMWVIRGIG